MNNTNSEIKQCQNCKNNFEIEAQDFTFYEKMAVPAPTFCYMCRVQRRFLWRNEKTLFKRKCDATGKEIFTMFHPDAPIKVYDRDYWWSDEWDPLEYGRDYDFSKPFFEQFFELTREVPWFSRSVLDLVNSDYCMNCGQLKDCYLTFHSNHCEHCYYSVGIETSKDCFDNLYMIGSELCYGCFACAKSYKAFYADDCNDSHDIYFCKECGGCSYCIGCVGLKNKQYHIFNKPYSKEEYFKELEKFNFGSWGKVSEFAQKFEKFKLNFPVKSSLEHSNTDISGNYISHCKNVHNSYLMRNCENCRYSQFIFHTPGAKDCYDYTIWGQGAELIYECCQVGLEASNLKFCAFCYPSSERLEYCVMCHSSRDLFGCMGLKKKQFCIFNKQYSEEEYKKLVPKIIEHMKEAPHKDKFGHIYKYGEFFPPEFSPFAYNETLTQEFFTLSEKEAKNVGYDWRNPELKKHEPTVSWKDLPDNTKDADNLVLNQIILCKEWDENMERAQEHNCTKVFKILPDELSFYRRMNIPLPRKCFNSRHYDRTKLRNPMQLWPRGCECLGKVPARGDYFNFAVHFHGENPCLNKFETSFAPDRPESVYCRECFNAERA